MKTDIAYIYALIDPRDNSIRYIGKTICPKNRISGHINESKKYDHHRAKWIRSLTKIGISPIFKILKICPLSEFEKYETEFIKKYKSNNLTNSDDSGKGNINRKREIIERSSTKTSKKVYQYNLEGRLVNIFKSARESGRNLGIDHSYIIRCCNNIYKHTNKYIFKYQESNILPLVNPNSIKKIILEINKCGEVINRWESLMDCSRETKIDSGNISKVCNGKLKSTNKRIFTFLPE